MKYIHFTTNGELKDAVRSWIKKRPPAFFIDEMRKQVHHWEKGVDANGDYVEK